MRGYNFTDEVRGVLAASREAAVRLHHEYVGTEHLLLGIVARDEGTARLVLARLDVEADDLRQAVETMAKRGRLYPMDGRDLPYTSRAKVVLELAMTAAREVGHSYVGSEHLLLGLIREHNGLAAQILAQAGVTEDRARAAMFEVLGGAPASSQAGHGSAQTSAALGSPTLVVVEVRYADGWTQRRRFDTPAEAMAFLADR